MPSAVIESAAAPTLAVAVAAESVFEHAEATRMAAVPSKAANRGRWVIVFTGFTREGETSRLAGLPPRTVHRIGKNEVPASELGKDTRWTARPVSYPGNRECCPFGGEAGKADPSLRSG